MYWFALLLWSAGDMRVNIKSGSFLHSSRMTICMLTVETANASVGFFFCVFRPSSLMSETSTPSLPVFLTTPTATRGTSKGNWTIEA